MAQDPRFPFDLGKFSDFFSSGDFAKGFAGLKLDDLDPKKLFAAQQENMAALMQAGQSAASNYQVLFQKQLSVFEQAVADAQAYFKSASAGALDAESAKANAEAVKTAFQKAMENMAEMAESAQKANSETFKLVSDRVSSSVAELQELAAKFKT